MTVSQGEREALKQQAEAISMWRARFDTYEIGLRLGLDEWVVARWIAAARDAVVSTAKG